MSCCSFGTEESSKTKIPKLDDTLSRDKHISRFDVSVHDTSRVHVVESTANLYEVFPDSLLGDQSVLFLEVLNHS